MTTLYQQWLADSGADAGQSSPSQPAGYWLADLCAMSFTGPDVVNFLQGYLTCDTTQLDTERPSPWALCNLKGRVVANGWCLLTAPDCIKVVVHRSLADEVATFFKPYLLFAKSELHSHAQDTLVFGTVGAALPGALQIAEDQHIYLVDDLASAQALSDPALTSDAWYLELLRGGMCLVEAATSGQFLPQMLGLERVGAVSFDKGCYLGQEVVARAQHRGAVKRLPQLLSWQGGDPNAGDPLNAPSGRSCGTLVNVVATSSASGLALAVVATDADFPLEHAATQLNPAA